MQRICNRRSRMKKNALLILCIALLASGSAAHARPGLTAGFHSGLATEGGPFCRTLDAKAAGADIVLTQAAQNTGNVQSSFELEQSRRTIPDLSLSAQYEFRSGLFIRSGIDFAVLASGKDVSYSITSSDYNTTSRYKFSYSAESFIIPLYAGFSLYPGRSPVGIYGAIGAAFGNASAERSERIETTQFDPALPTTYYSHTEWRTHSTSAPVIGLTALIGIEANVWKHVSLTIEYVFNDISDVKSKSGEIENVDKTGMMYYTRYKYTEHLGFPSQLIRFGARFTL